MHILRFLPFLTVLFGLVFPAEAQEDGFGFEWPREIVTPDSTIVLYQPQLERFSGDVLEARMAASITATGSETPKFGATWIAARVSTDRDERIVQMLEAIRIDSKFPGASEAQTQAFDDLLRRGIRDADVFLSLDQLLTSLDAAERQQIADEGLKTAPPRIIVVEEPAVLVTIDGAPILQPIEDSALQAVVNTPFPMVYRPRDRSYYLMGDDTWFRARDLNGPWSESKRPPSDITALRTEQLEDVELPEGGWRAPRIIVVTDPTELIAIDGQPQYTPLEGGNLLYVHNTESDVLLDLDTNRHFIVLAGRWYEASSLQGPWSYVLAADLPPGVTAIPTGSAKAHLRLHVPGTDEAREAVLDAYIPQTAMVVRGEATLEVVYDGGPEFQPVPGTVIQYAVNASVPVLFVNGAYYAVDDGVWFFSVSPRGPWQVADRVPQAVQQIPPSSPVYHVKYVYIYDSTPDVVYVGYTPGYVGSYVFHGTVVFGTGHRYRPWYRAYYFPRPRTWGFNIHYRPYYGWGLGFGYVRGPFSFWIGHSWWRHHRHATWWGPRHYTPHRHYRAKRRVHVRTSHMTTVRAPRRNLYHSRRDIRHVERRDRDRDRAVRLRPPHRPDRPDRVIPPDRPHRPDRPDRADRPDRPEAGDPPATKPRARRNNVFTDRSGRVYRYRDKGWERRDGKAWRRQDAAPKVPAAPSAAPQATPRPSPPPTPRVVKPPRPPASVTPPPPKPPSVSRQQRRAPATASNWQNVRKRLERDRSARQRGEQRTRTYRQERSRRAPPRQRSRDSGGRQRGN